MKSIEILEREHQWIGWMAECLEALVIHAKTTDTLPQEAYELMPLYETFADGRHQEKEESVLFPELLGMADDRSTELLLRLLDDHATERSHMDQMRTSVLGAVQGEATCLRQFAREASEYLELHRAHMFRETEVLIPLANDLLSPEADARIVQGFEEIEGGPGDPHGLREQVLSLHERVGLPRPPAA